MGTFVAVVFVVVPLVAAMANKRALADQPGGYKLVRRIGEDEVGRVKADGVPKAKLLHRLVSTRSKRGRQATTTKFREGILLWSSNGGWRGRV